MPAKNTVREYDAPAYYHIYNRGAGKQEIFHDSQDKEKLISLLARYLDPNDPQLRSDNVTYETYDIELLAYCLMGNHFHFLVFQEFDPTAITQLMRSVATAYTMYFNKKYKQSGHLFQGAFKASRITNEAYLLHISRYIHMNPRSYLRYQWSSLSVYLGSDSPPWLHTDRIRSMPPKQYREFLESYEGKKAELEMLKDQLAG